MRNPAAAVLISLSLILVASSPSLARWKEAVLELKTPTRSNTDAVRSRLYVLPGETVRVQVEGRVGRYPSDKPADFRGQPLHCGSSRSQPTLCNLTLFCFVAGRTSGPEEELVDRAGRYMNYHHPSARKERGGFSWTAEDAGFVHCGIYSVHSTEQAQGGFKVRLTIEETPPGF